MEKVSNQAIVVSLLSITTIKYNLQSGNILISGACRIERIINECQSLHLQYYTVDTSPLGIYNTVEDSRKYRIVESWVLSYSDYE